MDCLLVHSYSLTDIGLSQLFQFADLLYPNHELLQHANIHA